jgi:serine/threonine protein kinase
MLVLLSRLTFAVYQSLPVQKELSESTVISEPTTLVADAPARDFFDIAKKPIIYLAIAGLFALPSTVSLIACIFVFCAHMLQPGLRQGHSLKNAWKVPLVQKAIMLCCTIWFVRSAVPIMAAGIPCHPICKLGVLSAVLIPEALFLIYLGISLKAARKLLASHRASAKWWQFWTDGTYAGYMTAFAVSLVTVGFVPWGPGHWVSQWLLASARDASFDLTEFCAKTINIFGTHANPYVQILPPASIGFEFIVKSLLTLVGAWILWPSANRAAIFLTAFTKRQSGSDDVSFANNFVRTMRSSSTQLKLREDKPFLKNVAHSFWWLLTCYLALFSLVGFSGGPLGEGIKGWLDASIADAHTGMMYGATANPSLRIFCAAIVALYGTVPVAVMSCSFLPYFKRREIELNSDGLMLPDGPYISVGFRPMRLWSDLALLDVTAPKKGANANNAKLIIKFHTGGKLVIKVSQLAPTSIDKLLGAIDEHAGNCVVTDAAVNLRANVRTEIAASTNANELGSKSAENFQSTIFVPHDQGTWLPNGESRVVRMLASRPLSCVYLVRMNTGKLAIAKQFFLSEENEQHADLRKTFEREYELLRKIDNPSVSKVLDMFHREESTYLIIEHAEGMDLHKLVADEGPQSEIVVMKWALEICDIMTALHSQDPPIVHRDLTPDNLVLTEDGRVRIIDFGAAHQFMEGITGTIIGKQCYVPPEQLQGQAGPRSDIYSFGCTLHYLLTGKEPVALSQCEPNETANVFRSLNALVMQCTEFDDSKRPNSFDEVRTALVSIQAEKLKEPERLIQRLNNTLMEASLSMHEEKDPEVSDATPPTVIKIQQAEEIAD